MAGVNSTDLVTAIDDLAGYTTEKPVKTRGSSELGKEEFLQLLVCQLQNQDPLNPQSDQEFVAQLAQFSALEQMTNMSATLTNTSAYGLVGKEVIVSHKDSAGNVKEVRGTVDYVEMQNGDAKLSINGELYSMDDLVQVMDSFYAIKEYLPSVEEQEIAYDLSNPSLSNIKINLGSNGYEAGSVVVTLNGTAIDTSHMTYEDGVLTISPKAFEGLTPGKYKLAFYFDDPYSTTVTDAVTIKVVNSGVNKGEKPKEDGDDTTTDPDEPGEEETDKTETE